jgi:trimethylamine--corrinoid protein Co-methyltransferase
LNLVHDVGYLDMAMVCSPAQLVLGNDAIGWAKRFIRGIEVNRDTLAREVIEAVGPGGHFLQQQHTLDHFRKELWRPQLLTRQHYNKWEKDGAKDLYQRIQEKIKDILDNHPVRPLPDKIRAALKDIKQRGAKELIAK